MVPTQGQMLGMRLKSGALSSAAADWSQWPVGTRFRAVETGRSPQESLEILMSRRKSRPARKMVERLLIQDAT
jgi:hypothetical protein